MTEPEKEDMKKIAYRQAIGSLMWTAVATWPDISRITQIEVHTGSLPYRTKLEIAFAMSLLSQFLEKYRENSLEYSQVSHESFNT